MCCDLNPRPLEHECYPVTTGLTLLLNRDKILPRSISFCDLFEFHTDRQIFNSPEWIK